jgi:hypothetical protein
VLPACPGPSQDSPIGQHPYWPFVPSQQTSVKEQLPEPSGQHESLIDMHPIPQGSSPKPQEPARLELVGADVVAAPVGDEAAIVAVPTETAQLPSQTLPRGQQQGVPSSPVVQYSEVRQPPCWSAQQK